MKKIIISIFLILLLIIVFFQYQNYRRLNPPNSYEYTLNKEIDANYHNPVFVKEYYKGAFEIGMFAREQWYNHRIDMLFPDHDSELSMKASKVYLVMKEKVAEIENILLKSMELKNQGFSNLEIRQMELSGLGPDEFQLRKHLESNYLKIGDENDAVYEMQEKLRNKGYTLKVDGIFNIETKAAVMKFQKDHGIYPNGIADKRTLILLIKEK